MRKRESLYFFVLALIPLLVTLQARERAEFLHQTNLTLLKPVLLTSHAVSQFVRESAERAGRFWDLYRSHGVLTERIEVLERRLIEMEELRKENERLRELLQFKKEFPWKAIPARVIGRDLAPWRRTIVIDKGTRDGVRKRMAVVCSQGLVGRVVEAGPLSARVILLLDPESRVSTLLQGSRDLGVAEGQGATWLRMTHLDREATVQVGDRVVTSGLGGVYPKGIPIGVIEMVGTEKEGLELFASVRPFVDFSKLEEVLCIASSPPAS